MAKFDTVTDSGERENFSTGSRRDTRIGKGRYDLIPPSAMRRIAKHYENGAAKYGDRNWEKGQPISRYIDSSLRHIYCYLEGEQQEDHVAAAIWNLMAIIHTTEKVEAGTLPAALDDLNAKEEVPAGRPVPLEAADDAVKQIEQWNSWRS